VETRDDGEETAYLLDGCQRLSTICGALHWEPNGDPESFWNLVYDLEDERFLHRHDLADPPASQVEQPVSERGGAEGQRNGRQVQQ